MSRSTETWSARILEMLRPIDPTDRPRADLPLGDTLETAWRAAAEEICAAYKARLDPKRRQAELPASQRWALEILRSPDLPDKPEYDLADEALGVGRNQLVRRRLSEIRRHVADAERGTAGSRRGRGSRRRVRPST